MIRTGLHYGFSFRYFIFRIAIFFVIASFALALPARTAHASEVSDFVVDAVALAGGIAGVPIRESEKAFLKQLVADIANDTPIDQAMKNAVMRPLIEQLPPETRQAAACIAKGTSLAECAAREFSNAPEVVQCVAGGTALATCAQREAIRQLPQEVRNAAECVASREKVAECAKGQAREIIGKLENAARDQGDRAFKAAPTAIQNIVNIVDGVQKDDWAKVLQNGGAAFAKVIIRQVLAKFLSPALLAMAEPMISVSVENRITLMGDLIQAAKHGDVAAASRVLFEGYLTFQFEMQCSLPIIPQVVRDAVCGPLGEIIHALGGAVGSFTSSVLTLIAGAIKDPLGLPAAVVGMLIDPFDGLEKDCGTAEDYYARRFATCYPLAASQKLTSHAAFDTLERDINLQCRHYFARCFNSQDNKYGKICDPMSNTYKKHAQEMEKGLREAAETYKHELRRYLQSKGAETCDAGFADLEYKIFIAQCGSALQRQIPLGIPVASNFPGKATDMSTPNMAAPNCERRPGETVMFSGDSVGDTACGQTVSRREFEQVAKQICQMQPIPLTPENTALKDDRVPPRDTRPIGTVLGQPIPPGLTQPDGRILGLAVPPPNPNNLRPRHNIAISIAEKGQAAPNVNTGGPSAVQPNAPANAGVPRNNSPSGTAVACPPGATYFNGSCNSGGAYMVQPGGTGYDRSGRPITPPAANNVRSGTAIARGCPADSPVGVYPNCCPRYMTPDGRGGCSGISTVQPGGTSVQGRGNTVKLSPGNTTVGPVVKPAVAAVKPGIVPKEEPKKFRLRPTRVQPATPPRESLVR